MIVQLDNSHYHLGGREGEEEGEGEGKEQREGGQGRGEGGGGGERGEGKRRGRREDRRTRRDREGSRRENGGGKAYAKYIDKNEYRPTGPTPLTPPTRRAPLLHSRMHSCSAEVASHSSRATYGQGPSLKASSCASSCSFLHCLQNRLILLTPHQNQMKNKTALEPVGGGKERG